MEEINWNEISENEFEKLPSLRLEVGDETVIEFQDDGKLVKKEEMQNAQYPRDAFVFVVIEGEEKKNWWISKNDFSTMRQLKEIRKMGVLTGKKVNLKRVSNSPKEQNWVIEPVLDEKQVKLGEEKEE